MKETTKVSIKVTNVTFFKLTNDGEKLVDSIKLVGSHSIKSANQFINDGKSGLDLDKFKSIKVIEVTKGVEKYEVYTDKLYDFILSMGLENVVTSNSI